VVIAVILPVLGTRARRPGAGRWHLLTMPSASHGIG